MKEDNVELRDLEEGPVIVNKQIRNLLHVTHSEVQGDFRIAKPTFAVRGRLARARGAFLGAIPDQTSASDIDAEIFATISAGFDEVPEGFDPANIISMPLMQALYKEVGSYWATFQKE